MPARLIVEICLACSAVNKGKGTSTVIQTDLSNICLDKVRLDSNALVSILEASIPGSQLGIASSPVAEQLVCIRVDIGGTPCQSLCVELHCLGVVLVLERLFVHRMSVRGSLLCVQILSTKQSLTIDAQHVNEWITTSCFQKCAEESAILLSNHLP